MFSSSVSYTMALIHLSINSHVGMWKWEAATYEGQRLKDHEHIVKYRSFYFHLNSGFANYQISWLSSTHNEPAATSSPSPEASFVRQGGRRLIKKVDRQVRTLEVGIIWVCWEDDSSMGTKGLPMESDRAGRLQTEQSLWGLQVNIQWNND